MGKDNKTVDNSIVKCDNVTTQLEQLTQESIEDTVDDIVSNITEQVKRLHSVREKQEAKAKQLALEISRIQAKEKSALKEQKKALRIASKLSKLIA